MFTRSSSNRRRGAPYGNTNALKHGLTIQKYRYAPFQVLTQQQAEKVAALFTEPEEIELLRTFFCCMASLFPETDHLIASSPYFRKLFLILFLRAARMRARRPLSPEDYLCLINHLEKLTRLVVHI